MGSILGLQDTPAVLTVSVRTHSHPRCGESKRG